MSQNVFNALAKFSVREAQLQAERAGLSQATIETWMKAIGQSDAQLLSM